MSSFSDLPVLVLDGAILDSLHWGRDGLLPVISIADDDGAVLMAAYVNRTAFKQTLATGWATYWSRSRNALWIKGETSGHRQRIVEVRCDCDGDHLLYRVRSNGPACHTGRRSCFSWLISSSGGARCDQPILPLARSSPVAASTASSRE